ncbi:hypothetical protein E2C01_041470 [Portunus trituberculatus]|uniref:Uncharacterized protein n=1 Tax=Portunus trituberculatus TaxID=210409 RepID=A0A5B7FQT7_PORTR|nr:hypothetical protein [Portunus trituberculatus]
MYAGGDRGHAFPSLHYHNHHYHHHHHHPHHPPHTLHHEGKQQQYIRKFPAYKLPETFLVHINPVFNSRSSTAVIPYPPKAPLAAPSYRCISLYLSPSRRFTYLISFTSSHLTSRLPIPLT